MTASRYSGDRAGPVRISLTEWRAAAVRLGLQRRGGELVGPCPACGGKDRFRVTRRGGFFCRQCCPDRNAGANAMRRILEAAGLAREDDGGRSDAGMPPAAAGRRAGAASPIPRYREGPERRSTAIYGGDDNPIPGQGRNIGPPLPEIADPGPEPLEPPREAPDAIARRIWTASRAGSRDTAPVRAYLAGRGVWPPHKALPGSVRWLDRAAAERLNPALPERQRIRLPRIAAGAIICCFARCDAGLVAVQIEPLQADGARAPWPARKPGGSPTTRQTRGAPKGAAFPVKPSDADLAGSLHVCEGPVDALAIAYWRGAQAWGAGGTSGLAPLAPELAATGRAVVIEADGDGPGRMAAAALQDALHRKGIAARLIYWPGCDPAEGLAADWQERAAQFEADGMDRVEAEHHAWEAMLPPGLEEPAGAGRQPTPGPAEEGIDHDTGRTMTDDR